MYFVITINKKLFVSWQEVTKIKGNGNYIIKKHLQRLYTDPTTGKKYMKRLDPYTGKYNRFTFDNNALYYADYKKAGYTEV